MSHLLGIVCVCVRVCFLSNPGNGGVGRILWLCITLASPHSQPLFGQLKLVIFLMC